MTVHSITPAPLDLNTITRLLNETHQLVLSDESARKIRDCRQYLEQKMEKDAAAVYGINTGFGILCDVKIDEKDLEQLQQNIVMSHACGTGDEVPGEIVKLMLFLKIHALSLGYSGVQLATVERLIFLYNNDILPVVYQLGSLGASGDLAPLAHLSLPLIGLGDVYYQGKKMPTQEVYTKMKIQPLRLRSKEGLALLNGTQFMSAYATWCLVKSRILADWADVCGAISLDSFDGKMDPFLAPLHRIRPHAGQVYVAAQMRTLLKDSELAAVPKKQVQDPYSFRCIPQVHGASRDTIDHSEKVILTEINSVTDNPTIFPEEDMILSGGNFHGQPLALVLDFLAIAIAELASISERRTYLLISGQRGLPSFLVANPGLNSGFMITQYTAASIVSKNKQLCTPAAVDSIVSSNGQEDHVSMGANAATKCLQVIQNTRRVLAIELLCAAQALEFRRPARTSFYLENVLRSYRAIVPFVSNDKVMYTEMHRTEEFFEQYRLG